MRALLRRFVQRPATSSPTIITAAGGNSLLEFRSEHEPLVLPAPPAPPPPVPEVKPQASRPFRMERERAARPVLPVLLFILMIGASATVIVLWWYQANQSPTVVRADASAYGEAVPAGALGTEGNSTRAFVTGTAGSLDVTSDPVGATVAINGVLRGRTPLVVKSLAPGRYTVTITAGSTTVRRTVTVTAGAISTLVASVVPARPEAGWVSIDMPFEAEVLERGRVLGTTASPRIALPPGAHDLELRHTGLGYNETVRVHVVAGQAVRPTVNAPTGLVSINALPWAEVSIDGRSVGTTPLANLPVAIGTHTIVFTHPTLGERRQTINVVGGTPVRLGVSFEE